MMSALESDRKVKKKPSLDILGSEEKNLQDGRHLSPDIGEGSKIRVDSAQSAEV